MGREITQELAERIRLKLCGSEKPKTTGGHDVYAVRYAGQVVGSVSIRRASKEKGHNYIPGDINVNMHFAKELGICTKSFDDYINCLRGKGLIAKEPEAALPAPKPSRPWDEVDWVALQEADAAQLPDGEPLAMAADAEDPPDDPSEESTK